MVSCEGGIAVGGWVLAVVGLLQDVERSADKGKGDLYCGDGLQRGYELVSN